jgi:type I restriction enzyme R subunit
VRELAEALEGKASIPMVAERLELIQEVQTDEFWQDVTVFRLETVRKRLRDLVKFIEKVGQKAVYTDFEDERGDDTPIPIAIGGAGQSFERFKEKVRHFLRPRERELPLQKLRLGLGLTREDLDALDRVLVEAKLGTEENYNTARQEGLSVFITSRSGSTGKQP